MKTISILLVSVSLCLPEHAFARGFGGGGGGMRGGGGGGARPSFGGGGGGARPSFGGGGGGVSRPNFGGGGGMSRPNFDGGGFSGGSRPNFGNIGGNSRPNIGGGNIGGGNFGGGNFGGGNFGGGNRPNIGSGNFPSTGNRPNIGGGINRPTTLPGNVNRPNMGGGLNRPGTGGPGNIANRPGGGNFNNVNINNNFNNFHNNNFAANRPYYNNWNHGNWNGNWNHGNGYWNGYAHGYYHGYMNGGWGGYWHGGYGGYWGRPWYAAPLAWGLGAWALGSIMYSSGYAMYSNPYYAGGGATAAYYDYSQPITVINQQADPYASMAAPSTDTGTTASPEIQEGTAHMNLARDAFKNGDYARASSEVDLAIKALPKDAALHEFRALIFFATKDYKQAAATLYAVLSAGPGWDWTTLSGMYANVTTYTEQLRMLEAYVKMNPTSAEAKFVLAYHYLTCGYSDSARKQYAEVLKLQPGDQLSSQMVKMLGGEAPKDASGNPTPQPPETGATNEVEAKAPADIDPARIVGNWTAKRPDGTSFTLNLIADSKFTWGFNKGDKKQEFGGKYSVDGAILVLEREDGAQMPGLVTLADKGFNFKLYGGPPDDTGLDFVP